MSVVAVRVTDKQIIIAADSIVCRGWSKTTKGDFTKINKDNGMIIGAVGSAQEASLMWHYMSTHKPASSSEKAVLEFIIEFSRWKNDLGANSTVANTYILVFNGKAFVIESMFVNEIKSHEAIGAGEDYANAALFLGHSASEAVKVACELCCYVAEPIVEYTMDK